MRNLIEKNQTLDFGEIHKRLRLTPAMEAGLAKDVLSIDEIVRLAE